jgi:hypothetical protein
VTCSVFEFEADKGEVVGDAAVDMLIKFGTVLDTVLFCPGVQFSAVAPLCYASKPLQRERVVHANSNDIEIA